jgi:hypothetical protein
MSREAAARRPHLLRRLAVGGLLVGTSTWSLLAIWLGGAGPGSEPVLRVGFALLWALLALLALIRSRRKAVVLFALFLAVLGGYLTLRPSTERAWALDQARMPVVRFEGDRVTIENVREFRYRSESEWDEQWSERTFDLRTLEGCDFIVEPFDGHPNVAHTMVSFRFTDGRALVVSVEIRKEAGETYAPLRGLFRQYELMYVVGDERDLVQLRTTYRRDRVYLHPIDASPEAVRAFLVDMLARADALGREPEFYNTLTSTCTTNLVLHWERFNGVALPFDWRVLLPGYADELAFELGLLDTDADFETTRARNRVDERAREIGDRADFSTALRSLTDD